MKTFEARQSTSGSPADVWTLLADASKWSQWGSWSESGLEGGGEHGPGAVRILVRRPFRIRERVTEWEPTERYGYEMVDGMRVRGYRSAITIVAQPGGGSEVTWRSEYEHADPVTATILKLAIRDACKRLAKAAER